jgi:hypothetical protein
MSSLKTFSADELADDLGCAPRWLIEGARNGRFPARKIGRSWRFTENDVAEILAICANGFFKPDTTTPLLRAMPMGSRLTATSRKRVVGSDPDPHQAGPPSSRAGRATWQR